MATHVRASQKIEIKEFTHKDSKIGNSNYPVATKNTTKSSNYNKDRLVKFLNKRYRPEN